MSDNNPTIEALDAVILLTENLQEQTRFYKDVLNFDLVNSFPDAAFFELGNQKFGLFENSHHPQAAQRLGGSSHGISHLEFAITKRNQAEFERRLDMAGARAYGDNFQDADGNLFHFNLR